MHFAPLPEKFKGILFSDSFFACCDKVIKDDNNIIRNIEIPLPPIEEQIRIVDYLNRRKGQMDSLISEKQALIDDLQAYKKSLIYEVVTGKRRVV